MIDPALPEETARVDARVLRQFAGFWLVLWSGIALWQLTAGRTIVATLIGGAAVLVGVAGLARPPLVRPIFSTLNVIARPIGIVMTRVVLAVAYYGLFTPLALVFRAIGRDPLHRARRATSSYWTARPGNSEPRRYFRQV
jgi:hypothetical protein